ncbi:MULTISPECIES: hypothetical protein [Prauserella salsuginis group]|uniref:Uncharacterized protein n=2 Tax=Prauserella salsuginis group TaxID=2893672 RepID=A0A839Y3A5_9PSEU|nr:MULTISPECIES: hypothetical protein [Prauserella salsuginis group]MBB3666395.1 hypothetical protein [Prauserella sediminis]MCR3719133.1 hypothetical protein [Prauserella flava]MCR3735854.1 hypothetical protein [Prauserella salsuginis]
MTTCESEWDEDSRAHVLALLAVEEQTCRCGGYLPETSDPANEGRYTASPPVRCYRCEVLHAHMQSYDKPDPAWVAWPVEKR